jgi:hypothetical protein
VTRKVRRGGAWVDVGGTPTATLALAPSPIEYSASVTVTASATPHTKGAWAELIASTSATATGLLIFPSGSSATGNDTRMLLDIGTGAAASETVKVANIPTGGLVAVGNGAGPSMALYVPLAVPSGTRIAARIQGVVASDTLAVVVATSDGTGDGVTSLDTLGADTANSRGVNMPTSDTYVEVTASTARAYRALIVMPCAGASTNMTSESSTFTLATGGAGSEVAVGVYQTSTGATETMAGLGPCAVFTGTFSAGSRIACKQSVGRNYRDVIVIGVP